MYKYNDNLFTKKEIENIEEDILLHIEDIKKYDFQEIDKIDCFIENVSYIQLGKKIFFELLSYTKYRKKEYLLSYYYGKECFLLNKNSVGIVYAILSLLNLRLYEKAEFLYENNKEKIIEIINSNKVDINDFIDILIYFKIPMVLIDDFNIIENIKDLKLKYIYILIGIILERKKSIKNNDDFKNYIEDVLDILKQLDLYQIHNIYKMKLENDEDYTYMLPCDNINHHIGKALIDIIDFESKSYYMPKSVCRYDFCDEHIEIISYKSKSMVSMHIIKIDEDIIVIDCGCKVLSKDKSKIDVVDFFIRNNLDINSIKCLIITHAHLDHYGSMDVITPYTNKIFMTKDTYEIINIINKDYITDSNKIILKKENDSFNIGKINIEFFPSNHIKGSIGIFIEFNGKKLLHTSDFSFNKNITSTYINEDFFKKYKDINYLIMESTYGNKNIEIPFEYKKKLITYFIDLSIKNNIKVLLPSSAIGKAQETHNLIRNSTIKGDILVDGIAKNISIYYNLLDKSDDIEYSLYEKYCKNNIIIASGGSLNDGSISEKYYDLSLKDNKMVTVIISGFLDKETYENKIKPFDTIKINFINISIPFHANYLELNKVIDIIKPKNLIFVHGEGIKKWC